MRKSIRARYKTTARAARAVELLRLLQRTAMVRAATDLEPPALSCERFLPARHGIPAERAEAGAEVEELLDRFRPGGSPDDENGPGH